MIKKNNKKKKSLRQAKKTAWIMFSKYIRMRDCLKTLNSTKYGLCCTCGKMFKFEELQAGHFTSGRKLSTLFDEINVHAQCRACNIFKQGNKFEYAAFMIKRYGEDEILNLHTKDHVIKKYSVNDYLEIEQEYKIKYFELLKEK